MSDELDDLVVTLRARDLYAEADAITRLRADLAAAQADIDTLRECAKEEMERAEKAEAERDAALAENDRKIARIADFIEEQVKVTRAYAKDSDMGRNNVTLMEIATSHFLDAARVLRALASEART